MPATLHMICGKIGAGKSTLAQQLGAGANTVILSEDAWLAALYGDEMHTLKDFVRCSAKLKTAMGPHIVSLLRAGVSVVLDYQANTRDARIWMRGLFTDAQAEHRLHLLDVPDEVCLARLHARNADGEHPFAATEAQFHQVTKHFLPPQDDEGFTVVTHTAPA